MRAEKKGDRMQDRTLCNWLRDAQRKIDKERVGEKTHWITSIYEMGCSNPPLTTGPHLFGSLLPKRGSMKSGWATEREGENMYVRGNGVCEL